MDVMTDTNIQSEQTQQQNISNSKPTNQLSKANKSKIAIFFICYSITIFLLSVGINQNKDTINILKGDMKEYEELSGNGTNNTKDFNEHNRIICRVNDFSNIVTVYCFDKIKQFSLTETFNYTKCDFD